MRRTNHSFIEDRRSYSRRPVRPVPTVGSQIMSPSPSKPLELVCPTGNLPSLKTAVDHPAVSGRVGCPPLGDVKLSRDTPADIQARCPAGVETEVFAYRCLPLTYSARFHNLPKDDCQFGVK